MFLFCSFQLSFSLSFFLFFFFSLSLSLSSARALAKDRKKKTRGGWVRGSVCPTRARPPRSLGLRRRLLSKKMGYILLLWWRNQPNKGGTFRFFFEPGTRPDPLRSFYKFLFFDWFERSPKDGFFFAAAGGIFRLKFLFSSKSRKKFKKKTHHTHTQKPMTDWWLPCCLCC